MSRQEFLGMAPREIALYAERLDMRRREHQIETAKILAMLANCHFDRDKAGKPEGWSPMDFLPECQSEFDTSMKDFVLALERDEFSSPFTDAERAEISEFNKKVKSYFANDPKAVVIQEKI